MDFSWRLGTKDLDDGQLKLHDSYINTKRNGNASDKKATA